MKKAIMVATVPSMIGQFNMNNIRILQELGYEVHVVCNFHDTSVWTVARTKEFLAELKGKRICYHQIDFPRKPSNLKSVFSAYRQLMNLVRNEEYDLIHCHTPIAGVISRLVAHKQKIKVIYTAHGFHFYQGASFINWIFYYPIEWLCSWWTDVLITINKEDYNRAKKRMHAKKTVYVPGVGIDTDSFKKGTIDIEKKRAELGVQDEDIMLLSVGELSARKNHEIVIRALHELKNPYVKYFICGKGNLKSYLTSLIQNLGMSNQVNLLGFRTDISELCQAADLFLLPSHQEGVSVALMEAIACQVPVVCSKIRGNEDIVRDYLFDENNVQELARLLKTTMTTREKLHVIMDKSVQTNYERLKNFDLLHVSKEMKKLYEMNK